MTCRATGNDVTLESVTLIRVKVTGEITELLKVTQNSPQNQIMSQDEAIGDARLKNNTEYIFLEERFLNESFCAPNFFLCETVFTTSSGKTDRAIAMTSFGQPEHLQPDVEVSNSSKSLADLQAAVTELSAAFQTLSKSHTKILSEREDEKQMRANDSSRISYLEEKKTSLGKVECSNPCANFSQVFESPERRSEYLDSLNISEETSKEIKVRDVSKCSLR